MEVRKNPETSGNLLVTSRQTVKQRERERERERECVRERSEEDTEGRDERVESEGPEERRGKKIETLRIKRYPYFVSNIR